MNSGLGGPGNRYNNYCVDNDGWDNYTPYYSDTDEYGTSFNCLRRKICGEAGERSCYFSGAASELQSLLSEEVLYGDDDDDQDYRYRLELKHGGAHVKIGGYWKTGGGHLGSLGKSSDDPIFYLLHSFVDYQYALWQDCRDHELINDDNDITTNMYNGHEYPLNSYLEFGVLADQEWANIHNDPVLVADMHSIADWNVAYDKGTYFGRANVEHDSSICKDRINSLWFKDVTRRRLKDEESASDNGEYSRQVFQQINRKYGCQKTAEENEKAEVFKTWAQLDCHFLTIGNNCQRPKYFDDCSDMTRDTLVVGTGKYDIDITLEELIEKISDYPCMVETRKMYYGWAKEIGNLFGLCRGDYDTFCERGFITKQQGEAKCVANQHKKENHKEKGYQQ